MKTAREIAQETGKSPGRIRAVITQLGITKHYKPAETKPILQITDEDSIKVKAYFDKINYAIPEKNTKRKFSPTVREMLMESYL